MKFLINIFILTASLMYLGSGNLILAQNDTLRPQRINFHFQQTTVTQYHPAFKAKYTGDHSMQTEAEGQTSLTATIFLGLKLWKGASFYFNPEIAGGAGLSRAQGVAGFPNGETFRVGDPKPQIYVARAFFQQFIALDSTTEKVVDDANQLRDDLPKNYFRIVAGKFCLADYLDGNAFSHDPRSQFLNWSLMSYGGWDYAANTRGYTWGTVLEWCKNKWSIRLAATLVPDNANGPYLDLKVNKAHAEMLEIERRYKIGSQNGRVQLLGFINSARMGNYNQVVRLAQEAQVIPDIETGRGYGRTKYGFGINIEQNLSEQAGLFTRVSWNDGNNETWAFTEIDHSACVGISVKGQKWKRPLDVAGLAFVANGISAPHQNYLKNGGKGFMIGDGTIHYAPELITEFYYSFHLHDQHFWLSPDYQFVINPAYNQDRGPVHVFSLRFHVEF